MGRTALSGRVEVERTGSEPALVSFVVVVASSRREGGHSETEASGFLTITPLATAGGVRGWEKGGGGTLVGGGEGLAAALLGAVDGEVPDGIRDLAKGPLPLGDLARVEGLGGGGDLQGRPLHVQGRPQPRPLVLGALCHGPPTAVILSRMGVEGKGANEGLELAAGARHGGGCLGEDRRNSTAVQRGCRWWCEGVCVQVRGRGGWCNEMPGATTLTSGCWGDFESQASCVRRGGALSTPRPCYGTRPTTDPSIPRPQQQGSTQSPWIWGWRVCGALADPLEKRTPRGSCTSLSLGCCRLANATRGKKEAGDNVAKHSQSNPPWGTGPPGGTLSQ